LRQHIEKYHADEFRKVAAAKDWKFKLPHDKNTTAPPPVEGERPEFTLERLVEYLVNFIVADDQVCLFSYQILSPLTIISSL
jgi:hypothetical protein